MILKANANVGALSMVIGDLERGESLMRENLAGNLRVHGPDHPAVAIALANLAEVAAERGRLDEAADLFTRSLAITERKLGPDHSDLCVALANLGQIELERGDLEHAESLARRALTLATRSFGPESDQTSAARMVLAELAVERHQPGAMQELDAIARIATSSPLEPAALALYRFTRARALIASGGDRTEAASLARQALAYHSASNPVRTKQISAWLAHHRL